MCVRVCVGGGGEKEVNIHKSIRNGRRRGGGRKKAYMLSNYFF